MSIFDEPVKKKRKSKSKSKSKSKRKKVYEIRESKLSEIDNIDEVDERMKERISKLEDRAEKIGKLSGKIIRGGAKLFDTLDERRSKKKVKKILAEDKIDIVRPKEKSLRERIHEIATEEQRKNSLKDLEIDVI